VTVDIRRPLMASGVPSSSWAVDGSPSVHGQCTRASSALLGPATSARAAHAEVSIPRQSRGLYVV
jgi:hypothetical protein